MYLISLLFITINGLLYTNCYEYLKNNVINTPHHIIHHKGAVTHPTSGEYIPVEFFEAARKADQSKSKLQKQLQNFLENIHKNLTTSAVLSDTADFMHNSRHYIEKLNDLSAYFHDASKTVAEFAQKSEQFFEVSKNTSHLLLLKLRQVSPMQPMEVKTLLTNYFSEMEFFHIMFCEITDIVLEYTQDILRSLRKTFIHYADMQRNVLSAWNFKPDYQCCRRYMEFLQQWSALIFKCAAGSELDTAYDVYAMMDVNAKNIMRQLEFRVQRLFNCFSFGNHEIHCRFLYQAEDDFKKLFAKLEDIEMYYDIKTKRGRFSIDGIRRQYRSWNLRRSQTLNLSINLNANKNLIIIETNKCMPIGFPEAQMSLNLKKCFYFPGAIY